MNETKYGPPPHTRMKNLQQAIVSRTTGSQCCVSRRFVNYKSNCGIWKRGQKALNRIRHTHYRCHHYIRCSRVYIATEHATVVWTLDMDRLYITSSLPDEYINFKSHWSCIWMLVTWQAYTTHSVQITNIISVMRVGWLFFTKAMRCQNNG